jgi:hypothetical protein
MLRKLYSALLAGGLTLAAGAAMADPIALTDVQLDGVNAGAAAAAIGASAALGDLIAETVSVSGAVAVAGNSATATNKTAALAVSTLFGAAAVSESASAATLP